MPSPSSLVLSPVTTGAGYYLASLAALHLTRGSDGIATLWPSAGILFAALLASSVKRAGWHILAATIASLGANLSVGNALLPSFGFTIANMVESSLAVWLLRTRATCRVSFTTPGGLNCFCKAAVIGCAVSATVATGAAMGSSVAFWFSWFSTDLLGILVVTPVVLIVGRGIHRNGFDVDLRTLGHMLTVFGMVTIVAFLTFWQSSYPLLFLPMLAVLLAALRLGSVGAAGGVLIVAAASLVAISNGTGPYMLVDGGPLVRSLFVQLYLLTVFAAALPIAALLTARERLSAQLGEKVRLLQLAEGAAQVGHWRLDTATQSITWSQGVFRIHGIAGSTPPEFDKAIEAYHPDDRARVSELIERSIDQRIGFEFAARIVRPDGEVRHVYSRGEIDRVEDVDSVGLFGIIQDVTMQVAHEAAIEDARLRAEEAAREATIMAETDQLTGIANRRRTVCALDQAVLTCRQIDRPIAVAMFDIDHFKAINDTFGHQAGDEVLKRIASDAAGELRSGDTVGRFGGEEFVMVLPNATAQTALMVAERVRSAIEKGGNNPRVTISVGVAELAAGETSESLLHRADQALYVAKREGRNTLRLAA